MPCYSYMHAHRSAGIIRQICNPAISSQDQPGILILSKDRWVARESEYQTGESLSSSLVTWLNEACVGAQIYVFFSYRLAR